MDVHVDENPIALCAMNASAKYILIMKQAGIDVQSATLGQKRFVLAAKTCFCWRAQHRPATLSQ
jgi:hypothetical protein